MDRTIWLQHFDNNKLPPWPCPTCRKGHACLVPKSFFNDETASSTRVRESSDWDPDWIEYVFSCRAECSNTSCKEPMAVIGKGGIGPSYDEELGNVWVDYFLVLHCHPMPHIIPIPKKCPSEVADPLISAFSMFWSNPEACAGRIRVSLEALMNHLGVPKQQISAKTGKEFELRLHGRIDLFAKSDPTIGAQMLALKWLGNAGSHDSGTVSHKDLLDAFEIIENALAEIIDERSKRVALLADQLTKKHGKDSAP